jgi:murein L,D-transpeptidase YcbB/YkuD
MKKFFPHSALLILFNLILVLNSCAQNKIDPDAPVLTQAAIKINFSSQTQTTLDSNQISQFFINYPQLKRYESNLWDFYGKRRFRYAWFENGEMIEQAGYLINRILNLEDDGVYKKLAYAEKLDSLAHGAALHKKGKHANLELELLLTAEYFVFSDLVWNGMTPLVSTANSWFLPRKKVDYDVYLDSLLKPSKGVINAQEPVFRQYELLKTYLKKYKQLADNHAWPLIDRKDALSVTKQVIKRLILLEDYQQQFKDTLVYQEELERALIRFQRRHGLDTTGSIDRATIFELNVPLKNRIKQILVNMERSRWLPVTSVGDVIAVNIPEFKMHVYHDKNLLWSCNVVVGKTVHPTTLFYGEMNTLVFSPYWNVPESIVKAEILPALKKQPDYLVKHRMEITGDHNGLPKIRQKPGPANALGLVKFLFPNSYSIYLHDTPSKSLFNETERAFSHGCIRIAEPAKLAEFLLRDDENWDPKKIQMAMNSGKERYVSLGKTTPVFIVYLTAFTDRQNSLNFRKDIYHLDERLAATIISGEGGY